MAGCTWFLNKERPMPVKVKLVKLAETAVPLFVEKNMSARLVVQVNPVKAEEAPKPSIRWCTLFQSTVHVCARPIVTAVNKANEANRKSVRIRECAFILRNRSDSG